MFDSNELLAKYEAFHKNNLNVATHFIGIPLIIFGLFIPMFWLQFTVYNLTISFADIFFFLVLIYYFKLNIALAFGMFITVGTIFISIFFI